MTAARPVVFLCLLALCAAVVVASLALAMLRGRRRRCCDRRRCQSVRPHSDTRCQRGAGHDGMHSSISPGQRVLWADPIKSDAP